MPGSIIIPIAKSKVTTAEVLKLAHQRSDAISVERAYHCMQDENERPMQALRPRFLHAQRRCLIA